MASTITIDGDRVDPRNYDLTDPVQANNFQNMVEDFMEVVRKNGAFFITRMELLNKFCVMVQDLNAWPHAQAVVPEFQLDQSHDTSRSSALNYVLKYVQRRRPQAEESEYQMNQEQIMVRNRIRAAVEYVETGGFGYGGGSSEQKTSMANVTLHAQNIAQQPPLEPTMAPPAVAPSNDRAAQGNATGLVKNGAVSDPF